jgi:deaminated glutathione amidase
MSAQVLRVGCVQMNTRDDVAANMRVATELVEEAAAAGARLIALPETWLFKGHSDGIRASAEPPDGPGNARLAALAARHEVYVLAGSVYEPAGADGRVFNTSALFGPDGTLLAMYRKLHLFDVTAGDKVYRESDDVVAGADLVTADIDVGVPRGPAGCEQHGPAGSPASGAEGDGSAASSGAEPARGTGPAGSPGAQPAPVRLGLTICYDLRFPELYRSLALIGSQVLCVPSAFTALTGAAHWEVLLRARAIENGCFVIAPGQVGEHLPGRVCYGHTMIVDPWGVILSELYDDIGVCVADLDLGRLADVRGQIPSLENRRPEAYRV